MANVNGSWDTVIESSSGEQKGVLKVEASGGSVTGTYTAEGNTTEIHSGKVDGDQLTWKMDVIEPVAATLDCAATVTGDAMSGTVTTNVFGNFPLTGTRA